MVGALVFHLRRNERANVPVAIVLILLLLFVAIARFAEVSILSPPRYRRTLGIEQNAAVGREREREQGPPRVVGHHRADQREVGAADQGGMAPASRWNGQLVSLITPSSRRVG